MTSTLSQRFIGEDAQLFRSSLAIPLQADREIESDSPMDAAIRTPLLAGCNGTRPVPLGHGLLHGADDGALLHHVAAGSGEFLHPGGQDVLISAEWWIAAVGMGKARREDDESTLLRLDASFLIKKLGFSTFSHAVEIQHGH